MGAAMAIVLGRVGSACVLDVGPKHACATTGDCLAGRVCVAGTCRAVSALFPDSGASDGGDDARDGAAGGVDGAGDAASGGDMAGAAGSGGAGVGDASSDAADARDGGAEVAPRYVSDGTPNYVFVTSDKHFLDFGTLAAADQLCNDAALAAHLPGTFRAWLSTASVDARDRIKAARGWIRPDGAPFADRVADIAAGRILYPPLVDETGGEVRPGAIADPVATGTDGTGVASPANCQSWTGVQRADQVMTGDVQGGPSLWTTGGHGGSCAMPMRIYCFGIDHVTSLSAVRSIGKKAFLSDGVFTTMMVDGADALCAAEAKRAGLPGTFQALIATTAQAAASRFPGGARRWVRMDGLPLGRPDEDMLVVGPTMAPLAVTSAGAYLAAIVLTGATSPTTLAPDLASSCADWTDYAGAGINGASAAMGGAWFDTGTPAYDGCARTNSHVYCLEK